MGLPICPTATGQGRHRQSRPRTGWPSGVTLNLADDAEVPGTRTAGRRPGSPPGSNLRTAEGDKLASSCWKLLEDLGTKKMEALWGGQGRKKVSASVHPPCKRWATTPNPPQKNTWTRRSHVTPEEEPGGVFPPKPLRPQRCTCGIPLAYKRRTKAPGEENGFPEGRRLGLVAHNTKSSISER